MVSTWKEQIYSIEINSTIPNRFIIHTFSSNASSRIFTFQKQFVKPFIISECIHQTLYNSSTLSPISVPFKQCNLKFRHNYPQTPQVFMTNISFQLRTFLIKKNAVFVVPYCLPIHSQTSRSCFRMEWLPSENLPNMYTCPSLASHASSSDGFRIGSSTQYIGIMSKRDGNRIHGVMQFVVDWKLLLEFIGLEPTDMDEKKQWTDWKVNLKWLFDQFNGKNWLVQSF